MAKGGQFEREFCWELSRWWTGHSNELIFWRTSNSGGGATVRRRKGIKNRAHAGDITAIEEVGKPFTSLITIEAKRGYNKSANFHSLLDFKRQTKKNKPIPQKMYEQWIEQAYLAAERAETKYWMIVHRRDGAESFCFFPNELFSQLYMGPLPRPFIAAQVDVRFSDKSVHHFSLVGMKWKTFLFHVDPDDIRRLANG
jgi:hypothetical protein